MVDNGDSADHARHEADAGSDEAARRRLLADYLSAHVGDLERTIQRYAQRAGIASDEGVRALARDVFQQVSVEALAASNRFDPERSPAPWLLGIAVNVLKRRQAEEVRRRHRELHILPRAADRAAGDDPLDRFTQAQPAASAALEDASAAEALLAPVDPDDRRVLRLALLCDCDSEALAQALGTSVGAARMRLHRALRRLRAVWIAAEQTANGLAGREGDPHV